MDIIENQQALEAAMKREKLLILQFGAESCAPCSAIKNRIQSWNLIHPGVRFCYLPTEKLPGVSAQMGVFTVPTVFVYVQGKLSIRQSGYFSLDQILQQAEKYEDLLEGEIQKTSDPS